MKPLKISIFLRMISFPRWFRENLVPNFRQKSCNFSQIQPKFSPRKPEKLKRSSKGRGGVHCNYYKNVEKWGNWREFGETEGNEKWKYCPKFYHVDHIFVGSFSGRKSGKSWNNLERIGRSGVWTAQKVQSWLFFRITIFCFNSIYFWFFLILMLSFSDFSLIKLLTPAGNKK